MTLLEYGMEAAAAKARSQARHWRDLQDRAVTRHEALIASDAAEAWDQVDAAVAGAREKAPAAVLEAGETASARMRGLLELRGAGTGTDSEEHTLTHALAGAGECCALISEIIRTLPGSEHHNEGDTP